MDLKIRDQMLGVEMRVFRVENAGLENAGTPIECGEPFKLDTAGRHEISRITHGDVLR